MSVLGETILQEEHNHKHLVQRALKFLGAWAFCIITGEMNWLWELWITFVRYEKGSFL